MIVATVKRLQYNNVDDGNKGKELKIIDKTLLNLIA